MPIVNFTSCLFQNKKRPTTTILLWNRHPLKTNKCNIAAATSKEYFRVGIFIQFYDSFIATLESRFTINKAIIVRLQCLVPADPTAGPSTKQIESIQALGEFYRSGLTKAPLEKCPNLIRG